MAAKTRAHKKETGFDKLARLIKSEGDDVRSEMDKRFKRVDERFDQVNIRLGRIESELAQINRRLDRLENDVDAMKGYSKEIDELRSRMKRIEKHLGIARSTI